MSKIPNPNEDKQNIILLLIYVLSKDPNTAPTPIIIIGTMKSSQK
jgi:hypothetical protein